MHTEAEHHKVHDHARTGCTAAWVGQKVTIEVTIHDGMLDLRPNGTGSEHIRRNLWAIFGKIYYQESINGPELGGTIEFEFKRHYKTKRAMQQTIVGHLRIERLSRVLSIEI